MKTSDRLNGLKLSLIKMSQQRSALNN